MGDTVRLRPNHYELLGLAPAASADEIRQAFARQLGLISVRPFGWLAQISVAHETLRDPAKRKAYDASLFPEPAPPPRRKAGGHPVMAQLFRSPQLAKPIAAAPVPAALPPRSRNQWKPAPLAPIVFKPPRPAADPVPPKASLTAEEMVRRTFLEEHKREPRAAVQPDPGLGAEDIAVADADSKIDWTLPALAAGALVLALAGGAWLGLESGNDNQDALPDPVATLKVAPARAAPAIPAPAIEASPATPGIAEAQPRRPARAPAAAPVERAREPLEIDLSGQQADTPQPEVAAVEQTAAEDGPVAAASNARLPLPDATVARIIRRIGYPCGAVASTTAMDAAGTFKVTCTSGHSYRAAPVRGRYHFRRMSGS